jgi:hypothetical protein
VTCLRADRRGVSIVEVLVVSVLLFGLLTLLAMFLVRGKKLAVKTETVGRVQHQASVLARKLSRDLYRGTWEGSQWEDGALIFLSSKPVNPIEPPVDFEPGTGKTMWKKWIAYYLDRNTNEVLRYESPLAAPTADPITAPLAWLLADLPPVTPGRPMARGISSFVPAGAGGARTIRFSIVAFGDVPLGNLGAAEKRVEVGISTLVQVSMVTP